MDHFTALRRRIGGLIGVVMVAVFLIGLGAFGGLRLLGFSLVPATGITVAIGIILSVLAGAILSSVVLRPLYVLWRTVTHLSDKTQNESPPRAEDLKIGRTLVSNLVAQVYQLASSVQESEGSSGTRRNTTIQSANIVSHMPLPLFVFNKELLVTNASDIGLEYCGLESSELFGKVLSESVNLEFPSENTLENWIEGCMKNKVTDTAYWERVRIVLPSGSDVKYRRCDMAAHYNKDNPAGTEFIVTMFDRTERYQQDDNSMGFVALAVHELRTPLTMLRGYIEVFVDELDEKLDDEMKDFLRKMDLSARQLNAFVGNILNVAKVEENALTLHLAKADWKDTLSEIVGEIQSKAKTNGKTLELHIDDDLPEVAIDKVSVFEIINNLVDNAIKYSGEEKKIIINSRMGKDGLVETTVQDFGVGIPESVVPHIFEKFYRNHRTKGQVGGSGLGLYLCKSLVNAHGGQIWVSSKPEEGSTFGFGLQPYDMAENAGDDNDGMTRTAHGWIKNHSLYRR
ncbi:MAG: ATP-binding protein [Candidatus Saccharibacteria bacterium]|nr:ATP-binding protein [Candidatus Saccharibacteria bacterium]